jgi:putative Flp pilus-assembly TadE/G-like protein
MTQETSMRRFASSRRRPGTVTLWFALSVWTLMGMAALTIDLGLVRATQREMQSITDEAAVEAVRNLNGTAEQRQNAAQNAILSPTGSTGSLEDTQTNNPQRFGAGPIFDFSGGVSLGNGFSGAQTLSIGSPSVYQPTLAVNASNAVDGDIVQGTYYPSLTTADPEADGYMRADLTPSTSGTAILVRLRRSNENFPPGDPSRSNGPPLAYLFGRGTMLATQLKGQGVTVRATSIAAAMPVLSAGWVQTVGSLTVPGVARVVLDLNSWNAWRNANPAALSINVTVDSTGNITGTDPTNKVSGFFTIPPPTPPPPQPMMIGDPVPAQNPQSTLGVGEQYVPLTGSVSGIGTVVVGFLSITGVSPNPDGLTYDIVLGTQIGGMNATTALIRPFTTWNPESLSSLFGLNQQNTMGLQAPALVR